MHISSFFDCACGIHPSSGIVNCNLYITGYVYEAKWYSIGMERNAACTVLLSIQLLLISFLASFHVHTFSRLPGTI